MPPIVKRTLRPGERIRVLVVDDSVVIRRLVTHTLEQEPWLEVAGTAPNGVIALQRIPQLNPDVITLDIEMPEMDGLTALRQIRRQYPQVRVIMFSTLTERGAAITLEALSAGADDYVPKASNEGSLDRSLERLRGELVLKIRQFFSLSANAPAAVKPPPAFTTPLLAQAVLIGVSTGGPAALGQLLPAFPADFSLPVLIVQHMPPVFTRLLAERLHQQCALPVSEAVAGEQVTGGRVYIAPGDFHMRLSKQSGGLLVELDQSPPLNSCRPAVDALFTSAADTLGGAAVAAVLTGMGQDGLRGAQLLKARGARILAQDEATSVVWGMPGALAQAGAADAILPLERVAPEILRLTGYRKGAAVA